MKKDMGITDEDEFVSRYHVWKEIKKHGIKIRKEHNESISCAKWLGVDGRDDTVAQLIVSHCQALL